MKLGYVIFHVADVGRTVDFYERAFGLARRFIHESGDFAEMETGGTALAFTSHRLLEQMDLPGRAAPPLPSPFGTEIALVTEDVDAALARALAAGATPERTATYYPWGQRVAYVRDPDGFLVELCTPVTPPG